MGNKAFRTIKISRADRKLQERQDALRMVSRMKRLPVIRSRRMTLRQ